MSVPFARAMHEVHHHTEDLKRVRVRVRGDNGVGRIHRLQDGSFRRKHKAFYRELAVMLGDMSSGANFAESALHYRAHCSSVF